VGSGERGDRLNLTVLGCGEAFDDRLPNTSLLLRTSAATILFDCGFTVPPEVWKHAPDANEIDAIYISHAHADHFFGMPGLLGRMWEEGRTKPLTVVSQPGVREAVEQALALGYRSLRKRFLFALHFVDALDGLHLLECRWRFALTKHSTPNLAVRIDSDSTAFCYSGDGGPTPESRRLYANCSVLVHEAFGFEPSEVHATVDEVLEAAEAARIGRVALVHIARAVRRERTGLMQALIRSHVRCLLPVPGDVIAIP
jgi:ribonuclease Z